MTDADMGWDVPRHRGAFAARVRRPDRIGSRFYDS
jgi:hypothetical protein